MSLVLGIASSHDASACVYRDGVLVAAISEERMSRVKCDGGRLPLLAIDECLRMVGATRGDVDHIASIYGHFPERFVTRATHAKELERRLSRALRALTGRSKDTQFSVSSLLKERRDRGEAEPRDLSKSFRYREFLSETGFRTDAQVHFVDHHLTHAIGAAFYSGFPECAVVTMDGEGDLDMHHGSYLWRDGRLDCWHESSTIGCSPGYFYMDVTESLGFRPLRHEGKVLGLAAFGDPSMLEAGFRKALRNSANGKGFDSDFAGMSGAYDARAAFIESLTRGHKREDVAAAAQSVFEKVIVNLVRNFLRESGQRRLAVNGGVFANVKLNQRIAALPECESLFVFPGMSDTGNCIGASLAVLEGLQPGFLRYKSHKLETVYWGTDPGAEEIHAELERRGLAYEKVGIDGVTERTAQAIHAGKVVGWFQGAMEFGPRALGNRSMVAAPTDKSINDWFNARLERSEFMPFAPSALAEYADQVFMNVESGRHAAEFMTITFDVRPEWRSKIPAVVHVDGTARPQLVRRDRNPKYWGLIERYRQLSGIPLVLNTSFNVHEEPIVCGPSEAIQAVVDNRVDHLAIGDFWVPGGARHT